MRRFFSNSAFLLSNDVLTRATIFILYALIARYLGAYQFGQLSLALTILFTFQILAPAGLRLLITREVANDRTKTDLYLVNGSLIAVIFSILSYAFLIIAILLLNYSRDTTATILLVALSLLPFSLSTICEAIFQGWERMQYITIANLPRNLIVIALAYLVLSQGFGLDSIAWILSLSFVLLLAIEWWFILRYISRPRLKIDLNFSVQTTRTSMTFLGFQGTLALSTTLIFLFLSKFSDETAVGYYNAANQVMMPMLLIFQSIVISIFPAMCQRFEDGIQSLKILSDQLVIFLLTISLPFVVGVFFLSKDILLLLYGNQEFAIASGALRLLLITLLFRSVTSVLGRDLLASNREKFVLQIVLISSFVYVFSGFFLIRQYGLIGAALTGIIFALFDFILAYLYVSRLFSTAIPWRRLWKPLIAAGALTAFLIFINIPFAFITVLVGGVIYVIVLLFLYIWSAGSLKQFKLKYQTLWSEQ